MGHEYAHAIKPGGRIFLYYTGCNAGIFIYRFSSAGRAPVSKTGSAGSSPASGANLPGRPEKLTYMIFFLLSRALPGGYYFKNDDISKDPAGSFFIPPARKGQHGKPAVCEWSAAAQIQSAF